MAYLSRLRLFLFLGLASSMKNERLLLYRFIIQFLLVFSLDGFAH